MNVLVVGCGSIGRKRALVLVEMGHEVYVRDVDKRREIDLVSLGCHHFDPSVSIDAEFICTPPEIRLSPVLDSIHDRKPLGLFIEKPISLDSVELTAIAALEQANSEMVMMGACNLRFTPEIKTLRGIRMKEATYRMGQHSKHWSPNHKPITLALDSIHEIDLAVHLNGEVKSIAGFSNEDDCRLSLHHENGVVSYVIMDRYTDPPVRWVACRDEAAQETISSLTTTGSTMYEREMEHFLICCKSGEPTINPISDAVAVNKLVLEIC